MLVDVRPDRPDHVYLSDFGLTKGSQSSVALTGTNQVLGTPDYMAPLQANGLQANGDRTPAVPPRLPAATPHPAPPVFAPYQPVRNRPSPPPRQVRPLQPPRYPLITRPGWHVAAYLVPILLPVYGMFIAPALLFKRDRSVRMSVILGLEIGAIFSATIVIASITTTHHGQSATAYSGISFLFALFAFGLAVACLVQLCMRRQPSIPVLSDLAYRLAYGKTRRRS